MITIKDIAACFEAFAPLALQQSYDNSGLLVGNMDAHVDSALLTIDVTEAVIDEAIRKKCGLIISHHPLIYSGLKKLTGKNNVERTVIKAVKNDIAIYAAHTNIDAAAGGVNAKICEKLGLVNTKVLQPAEGKLKKLVTFIPADAAEKVRESVFNAGAGHIGNYDWCGYNIEGTGSFRAGDETNPYVGEKGKVHFENEIRFETIFPAWLQQSIVQALVSAHPYEEVAYDIYPLDNALETTGSGMVGNLPEPANEKDFLAHLKAIFGCSYIRHTTLRDEKVARVAVSGGAGSFLLKDAISAKADVFVSSDFKYHQFFDAENKIVIADVGHFESEQFTKELFYEVLVKNFPKFAVRFSEVNTNPVFYF
jgi:dinuclear metal center YbgI/SA1388 family protein